MRATAQDRDAAAMMGINVNQTISFTFFIAGALAGAAGLLFALYTTNVHFTTGFRVGLIAFTAAVLGGIGNLPGAVLGALMIGLIESFNNGLGWVTPGSDWTTSIIFGDPDRDPRRPPRGPARRAHAGGRLAYVATEPGRSIGRRSSARAGRGSSRGSIGAAVGFLVIACSRARPSRSSWPSLIGLALYIPAWDRVPYGKRVVVGDRDRARRPLSVLPAGHVRGADLRQLPERRHRGHDADLHHDGARPEHRRRLRGPARSRLRRLLRDGRLHGGLVRLAALLGERQELPFRRGRA